MILDSSAIIGILQKFKGKAISILEDKFTLDLALYELGNVIWKECVLRNVFSPEDAIANIKKLAEIMSIMKIESLNTKEDVAEAMRLATKLKITFYDSSYLYAAKKLNLTLVTEDMELKSKAEKVEVNAKTTEEI